MYTEFFATTIHYFLKRQYAIVVSIIFGQTSVTYKFDTAILLTLMITSLPISTENKNSDTDRAEV